MDPYSNLRRAYDTDTLITRAQYSLDIVTGKTISTNYIYITDSTGKGAWTDVFATISTVGTGIGYLPSSMYILNSTLSSQIYVTPFRFTSTVTGLGSAGYVSTLTLNSTVIGIYTYISSYIDPVELTSTIIGLGTDSYISASGLNVAISSFSTVLGPGGLLSTVQGLGSAKYVSTASLVSTVKGLGSAGYVSTPDLNVAISSFSTALGPGGLLSTVKGLGSAGYVSTPGLNVAISSFSTALGPGGLLSTVKGLGSAGYISSLSNITSVSTQALYTSSINGQTFGGPINSTTIGLGTIGYLSSLSNIPSISTQALYTSSINGQTFGGPINSTIIGLASVGYVSTSGLNVAISSFSTAFGPGGVAPYNLASTVKGLGSAGYISSLSNIPSISTQALYTSSINGQTFGGPINSTTIGLGTIGYLSSLSNIPSISTQALYTSSINGQTFGGPINSTIIGLASVGYVSTSGLNVAISSFSTAFGPGGVAPYNLASTVKGLGSAGYISSLSNITSVSTQVLYTSSINGQTFGGPINSTTIGLGTIGYVSSLSNIPSISTQALYTSSINGQTFGGPINSTTIGLGTIGYISSLSNISSIKFGNFSTYTFTYTGSDQSFTVAPGVTSLQVYAWGAGGGGNAGAGGAGALIMGAMPVQTGDTYTITVGVGGTSNGGYMGGSATGGGGTFFKKSGQNIIVAGAGGGGAGNGYVGGCGTVGVQAYSGGQTFAGQVLGRTRDEIAALGGDNHNGGGANTLVGPGLEGRDYGLGGTGGGGFYNGGPGGLGTGAGGAGSSFISTNISIIPGETTYGFGSRSNVGPGSQYPWYINNAGTGGGTYQIGYNGLVVIVSIFAGAFVSFNTANNLVISTQSLLINTSLLDVSNQGRFQILSTQALYTSSIGVNCNAPLFNLDVNGGGNFSNLVINGGAYPLSTNTSFLLSVFGSGSVGRVGGTTWTTISDSRVKENISLASYDRCYSDISTLSLYRYTYASSFFDAFPLADRNVLGFIAQEVSTIQPKAVQVNNTMGISDLQWLNMDQLNMSLYGAVKKLINDKESLESTVRDQASQISSLFSLVRNM